MPVSGPGQRPISTTNLSSTPAADAPSDVAAPATTSSTPASSWSASGNGTRPTVTDVPPPTVSQADIQATLPNPAKQEMQANIDKYTKALEVALNQDPMSIARGKTPVREGDELNADQQKAVLNASTDFLKDMPLGAMSPELAGAINDRLAAAGIKTKDLQTTKLKDLGSIGGDIAKSVVNDFRKNSPTAFYSLATTAAAAIGYVGYSQGSAKLASLGIKPELKQSLFKDHLEVKVGADWKAKFTDVGATGTLTAKTNLGSDANVSASITGNSRTGFDNARMDLNYDNHTSLTANAFVTADRKGLEDVGGSINYHPNPNLTLSGTIDHNFQTDRTTATGEAAWKVNKNVDFALSAGIDTQGNSAVGAGVRIRF